MVSCRKAAKLRTEAPVNGGRNYNGPKVAKFLVGQVKTNPYWLITVKPNLVAMCKGIVFKRG